MKAELVGIFGITSVALAAFGVAGFSNTVPNGVKQGTAVCTDTTRGTSENCPRPVKIAPGFYGTSIDDRLNAVPGTRYYSLKARAGQRLTLSFAGDGPLRAGISFPGGGGDGPFDGGGNTIALTVTGTYIVYIGQNTMAGEPWRGRFSIAFIVR